MFSNTSGNNSTAIGYNALYYHAIGTSNTAIGPQALENSTGFQNSAYGSLALSNSTTGIYNTAVGAQALWPNQAGDYNTSIGFSSNFSGANRINSISIGYNTQTTASYQVRIGSSSVTSIGGYANWTNISDGRAKKNIRAEVPGLSFINLLHPVTYNLDLDAIDEIQKSDDPKINRFIDSLRLARSPEEKEIFAKAKANKEKQVYSGFLAQDVEKAAQSVGYDFSGVDAPVNGNSAYGLRYDEFVVPLVKAVQELCEKNIRLQEQVNELNVRLYILVNSPNWKTEE